MTRPCIRGYLLAENRIQGRGGLAGRVRYRAGFLSTSDGLDSRALHIPRSMVNAMRTAIYIDGFNLYYWLRNLPYRWIDLKALAMNAIAREGETHEVVAVKYFTAYVSDTSADTQKSTRQDIYLKALKRHIPELSIYLGQFRRNAKQMPKAYRDGTTGPLVWVMDTEEKGSDVNLAVELLNDAWSNLYDMALVISNDSDLDRALMLSKRKQRRIGVLVRGDADVVSLRKASTFVKTLTVDHLRASLMPEDVSGIRIPQDWLEDEIASGARPRKG